MNADRLLTTRAVADWLGVSTASVLRWHQSGKLPGGFRLASGVIRWRRDELEDWLAGRREVVSDRVEA